MAIADFIQNIGSGTITTSAPTLSPANSASCALTFTLTGTDSSSGYISSYDSNTGTFSLNTNLAADQEILSLGVSVVADESGAAPATDSYTITFAKPNCLAFDATASLSPLEYTYSLDGTP